MSQCKNRIVPLLGTSWSTQGPRTYIIHSIINFYLKPGLLHWNWTSGTTATKSDFDISTVVVEKMPYSAANKKVAVVTPVTQAAFFFTDDTTKKVSKALTPGFETVKLLATKIPPVG